MVDGSEQLLDQAPQRFGSDQPEERPGALTVLGDHARIDEQPEVARDPWLGLSEDLGEVRDGQLAVTQQRHDAQARVLTNRLERVEHLIRTHPAII